MAFTPEVIVGIIGIILGILSLIMSWFFTKKALEQADKNLKTQLLYEDRKHALMKLQSLINETNNAEIRKKLDAFLGSNEGSYIPKEVSNSIYDGIKELEKFEDKNAWYPTQRTIDDYPSPDNELSNPYEGLTREEVFDELFDKEMDSFKYSVNQYIIESLTKI